jgi:hypothetical protein
VIDLTTFAVVYPTPEGGPVMMRLVAQRRGRMNAAITPKMTATFRSKAFLLGIGPLFVRTRLYDRQTERLPSPVYRPGSTWVNYTTVDNLWITYS